MNSALRSRSESIKFQNVQCGLITLKHIIFNLPCLVLQEYLRSLGNIDCNPQNYLEIKSQQKFMIIIQNEDIAAHVHKVTNNSTL